MIAAFQAADPSTSAYPFLTAAAANLLRAFGTEDQKRRLMQPMREGRFFGTMALSEPHAGSSLGDLRMRAIPQEDGTHHLVGDKMWISGGEHDLSETIVHLVLARLPDAPPGVKGISLFAVTRHHLDANGNPGARNGVELIGLNHKMGYRGTVNTALAFGASAPAVGELVGRPHEGLAAMFHMMNEARIGVGLGASMIGWPATGPRWPMPATADRAAIRTSGTLRPSPSSNTPMCGACCSPRRSWLKEVWRCRSSARPSSTTSRRGPLRNRAGEGPPRRAHAHRKGMAVRAGPTRQRPCHPGARGWYTRDHPVERHYRDNRLNPIHEGTNGVQGLDLLGRKVMRDMGPDCGCSSARSRPADEAS